VFKDSIQVVSEAYSIGLVVLSNQPIDLMGKTAYNRV